MSLGDIAPSGVNALPLPEQAAVFGASLGVVGLGTIALVAALGAAERAAPRAFGAWRKSWPILGVVYMAAGYAHFAFEPAFSAIYPPLGTW